MLAQNICCWRCWMTKTVKSHVGNILAKLHLAHRTQAAIYAFKQGVVGLDEVEL